MSDPVDLKALEERVASFQEQQRLLVSFTEKPIHFPLSAGMSNVVRLRDAQAHIIADLSPALISALREAVEALRKAKARVMRLADEQPIDDTLARIAEKVTL